jgi:diguanylate cyclase (GGDEF)-like protein/PAS domain S-box-containing protein
MGMQLTGRRHRHADDQAGIRLRRSEARAHALLADTEDVVALLDREGTIVYASPAVDRMLGRPAPTVVGSSPFDLIHRDDHNRVVANMRANGERPGATDRFEVRLQHADASWKTVETTVTNRVEDPAVNGFVVTLHDVTVQRRNEASLLELRARYRATFDHSPVGMAVVMLDGRMLRANRALAQMLGVAEDDLEHASVLSLTHPEDRDAADQAMRAAAAGHTVANRLEQRWMHSDGRPVRVAVSASPVRGSDGAPMYLVAQVEDISATEETDRLLAHQAVHDELTGLPNRAMFMEQLRRALSELEGRDRVAVMFIDLDHFKVVNDSLGHQAGDRLLVTVADRLRAATRPSDVVARFEGDTFTVLCNGVPDERDVRAVADRLVEAVSGPMVVSDSEHFVTASVGIAVADGDMDTPETLLRNADAAMHHAKDQGRARIEVFESDAHDRAANHLRTGNDLHRALERSELLLHYQPIVDLPTGKVSGFEALLRWQHPERGLVPPVDFIELAENTGLIVPIGTWVLEEACRQLVKWHDAGSDVSMSVNLSPRQLKEASLPEEVAAILERTGVRNNRVWLELTESTLMTNAEATITALEELRSLGVHLAVDDFGTGYSSMAYLKRFPVESLKIDRAFVSGIGEDPEDSAICDAVVSLAHALDLGVVAEGVETPKQVDALRGLGCERAQGFLFGRPQLPEVWGERPDARPLFFAGAA